MRKRYWVALTILAVLPVGAQGNTTPAPGTAVLDERDQLIRQRYEQVLERDPLQDAAFDRVYESYMLSEGVDAWLAKLKPADGATETQGGLVLRGRILARQFKVEEAVAALSRARELGATGPAFQTLLGRLYYETGNDAEAITLLGAALDVTDRPEQRAELCRMLGSVYLRSGKRAEAAAVWERIAALDSGDLFALQELAEIYEENRLWDEAIAARKRIVEAASSDPYRQCHAWRAIGQSLLAKDDSAGAIAAFEQGLALAAPGNWLFDDLKGRLVGVYESRGDLEGLSAYLEARIAQDATDLSLTELLADVSMRRGDTARAETLLKDVVARAPGRASALEMLIDLYGQSDRMEDLAATYEVLIAQYPAEPDYLRRLGEAWLDHKSPEKAQATWRRVLGDGTVASNHALLAEWLEGREFFSEAAAAYESALSLQPDREWRLRLASLKYDMGEEEAALAAWQASAAPEGTPASEVAEIAVILLSKEFKAEAEALYLRAMALAPDNLDYVLAYARLLAARGDHEGAATQYARLAGQDNNEYLKNEGERGLLDAYDALGTLDAQRAAWEAAIAQAPNDTAARLKLARLYARLGNRPGVVQLYEACVATAPERIEFQRLLAAAYTENRQSDKAIAVLEGLMARDTGRSQAYLRELLALYGAAGRPDEAVRAAEKLVELSPASPEARTALAQVYLRNGDVEKGLQQYRDLVQIDGTQPAYYKEFGDALQQNGKFGEAQEIYRKMLDAAADDATRLDAVGRLAAVYIRNGQRDVLLSEFQRRVSAAPRSLSAYQELAAIYRAAGDMRAALETLERAQGEVEDRDEVLRLVMTEAYQAGDHQKVLAAYEELMARSAQPTAYDLDRLASAYAQVGRTDEAQAVWERITRENPDDSAIQLMVARQLEGQGFYDEANACTERALAIDPYDHDFRFEYAQRLLGFNEVDRALEQMQKILDLGERPEVPSAPGAPGAPNAAPSPGPAALNSGMSPQAGPGFSGRSRWRGQTFGELRQQVVQSMVQASRQFEDVKPLLETYRKRIETQPENIDLRRDYLLVCEASNENELALETARALLHLQPGDTTLRWRILGYLQELGRMDEAIATATELSALPDENLARQARFMRIRLLAESNRFDEAEAVLAELTTDTPEMAQIYLQVASAFQNASNSDIADRLYQKAAELDPRFRHHALTGRARLLQERGEAKAARDLYIEAVFAPPADDQNTQAPPGRTPAPLYMPQGARRGRQSGNNVTQLPGFNFPYMDHQRAEALNQAYRLAATPEDFAPVISRLREASATYATAESDAQRQVATSLTYFLVACLRNTEQEAEAIATVQALLVQRPGDLALQNLVLFLLDEQGRFDEMNALYTEVEGANPAVAGDVARARLQLALAKEDTAAIPALFRALPNAVVTGSGRQFGASRASQLNQVVRTLENAGAQGEARALLEEELLRSRDAGILTLLSRSFAAEKNYDQAIAYAREAWEKQGGSRVHPGAAQYSMNAMSLQTQGQFGLEMLWNIYREAGREQELIDEFKTRLEGQPASLTLRQSLIGLYMESHQYDLAREAMEKLLELRPNDVPLKVRYAGLLEGNNDPAGALAVLESVASTRPTAARSIAGEIRRLYKDLGKKEELAAMDEKMIREARSAEELQQLARQLAEEGGFLQAAELMQKAQRIEPENTWLNFQIGDYLWKADKKSEAADVYLKFFQPLSPQTGIQIDVGRTPEIIQRVNEAGRLDALKAIAASSVPDPFSARSLKILEALIARHEKRPDDAEQILKAIAESAADQQVYGLLADLAEARGDLAGAIQYLEATISIVGATDYQRVAKLYLKTGDTAKSILNWKRFAEQHGGSFGNEEALRSLAEAGADEALAAYFREVYTSIPVTDPARQQLAMGMIRINQESGRYDALIDEVVFTADNKTVGELAREFVAVYNSLPGVALRRIVPLISRYPEDSQLQGLHAEILAEYGQWDEVLSIYERLIAQEGRGQDYRYAYLDALRRAGRWEKARDMALDLVRAEKYPEERLLGEVCHAVVACDGAPALIALRDELLAAADPDQKLRIRSPLIPELAANGEIAAARDTVRALLKEDSGFDSALRYFPFLVQYGFFDEAVTLYKGTLLPRGEDIVAKLESGDVVRAFLALGDPRAAWEHLLLAQRRLQPRYEVGRASRAFGLFQEYNTPATVLDGALEALRRQEPLPLNDRLFMAETEIALGRLPVAITLLGDHSDNNSAASILSNAGYSLPGELKDPVIQVPGSPLDPGVLLARSRDLAPPPSMEPARTQLHAAESVLSDGDKVRAIGLLDSVSMDDTTRPLLSFRARIYAAAGAFDKAIADYDAHLLAQPGDVDAFLRRAIARLMAGRYEEAMEDWRTTDPASRRGLTLDLAGALLAGKYLEEAQAVVAELSPADSGAMDAIMLRARILADMGKLEEMGALMEARYDDTSVSERAHLGNAYGTLLLQEDRWKSMIAGGVPPGGAALIDALLNVAGQLHEDEHGADRQRIADSLSGVQWINRRTAAEYGALLKRIGRNDAAIRVLLQALDLPRTDSFNDDNLLDELYNLGAYAECARATLRLMEEMPALIRRGSFLLHTALRSGEPILAEEVLERVLALAPTENAKEFYRALYAWYGPDKADGAARLAALVDAPETPAQYLEEIARIHAQEQDWAPLRKVRARLASAGGVREKLEWIRMLQEEGDLGGALETYVALSSAGRSIEGEAREAVMACAATLPFEAVDRLIVAQVTGAPAHPAVPDLLAMRAKLASRTGSVPTPLDLVALGVSEEARTTAILKSNMIDTWVVSKPVQVYSWTEMSAPLDGAMIGVLRGDPLPGEAPRAWRRVEAREILPDIRQYGQDWPDDWILPTNWSSFCLAEIESPDDRAVKLAHGSASWSRIWVNDAEVYRNFYDRINLTATDVIETTLHKGVNRLLVRVRSCEKGASFSLSIVENGTGLIVRAPILAQAQTDSAI